jgi:quinol monooxygenase YgiN
MEQPIAWILDVHLQPDQQAAFQALMADLIASTQDESGTLAYEFFGNEEGSVVLAYERFADQVAALAHVTIFGQQVAARLFAMGTPTRFTVLGAVTEELQTALSVLNPTYLQPLGRIDR